MKFLVIFLFMISLNIQARLDEIFDGHTSIEKPFELRDPFQAPKFETVEQTKRKEKLSGVWSHEKKLIEKVDFNDMTITGVLIGKERRVLINIKGTVYKLKEEDQLGSQGPTIKAILPGGIIVVEQITNIYGEPEYIETVIPISK